MIAKRIPREGNDSFRRLAEYIAAASDPGEKLDDLWIVNARSADEPEDLAVAIREIEAIQALNRRATGDKTYHLMVSFRDEVPSREALRDIETSFAEALGFGEHQRIAATHKNTENFHLHVAINQIHPDTGRVHRPYWDYRTLEKVSRAMEKKHGLKVDLGRADKEEPSKMPERARDAEAHTWEQSFHSYVMGHREAILASVKRAKSWQQVHEGMAKFGLAMRRHGNGLVIAQRPTKESGKPKQVKASSIDRSLAKKAMEGRFGAFQGPDRAKPLPRAEKRFKRRPITRYPGQGRLWRGYLKARARKAPSLMGMAWRCWRDYLMYGMVDDPMAMAIIYAQRKLMEALLSPLSGSGGAPASPAPPRPPRAAGQAEQIFLDVPQADKNEARRLGARWDDKAKRWYVPKGVDPQPFAIWREKQAKGVERGRPTRGKDVLGSQLPLQKEAKSSGRSQ